MYFICDFFRLPSDTKRELRKSTESLKMTLINDPNCSSHFPEYGTELYNKVLKPAREVDNYCDIN